MAAEFTVESDSYVKATVPTGATTGTVSVATSSGTLKSNPQFVVTQLGGVISAIALFDSVFFRHQQGCASLQNKQSCDSLRSCASSENQ
jgi:hypothetical protein